jgi:adenylate cyclase
MMPRTEDAGHPGPAPWEHPRDRPRAAFAAVLFADIVGFTRLCEAMDPAAAFTLLDGFHRRMAGAIAAHAAAVDDYIGDGVMAAWSGAGAASARSALCCGFAMLEAVEGWNRERIRRGAAALQVGIGLHAGAVMIGRTGGVPRTDGEPRTKLGVYGDTVNVANRLERMTRAYQARLIVSEDLYQAVAVAAPTEARLARFPLAVRARIPGRSQPLSIRVAAA